jgi:prepilin-type N-terminal cleavage/methylation domain-containing protein
MKPRRTGKRERGFTLIEMLASLGIFLLVTGAAFSLLTSSQQRYQTESEVLTSFQEARLGLDQMVRDINDAGFPPPTFTTSDPTKVTAAPFGWSPGYTVIPPSPCQIGTAGGGTCFTPTDFDIIVETEPNPADPACSGSVEWIRYQLAPNGTTLMRGVACKQAGAEPGIQTSQAGVLIPFVQNVVNNSPTLQIGQSQLDAAYPALFPGGAPVPIFQYTCETPGAPQSPPTPCPSAGADNAPANIRDVAITLIVAAPLPDPTTGQPRLLQLEGRGRRINPNQ